MNARTAPEHFASPFGEPVTGTLLFAGFQMTDTLQISLYGDLPDGDNEEYNVTGICLPTDPTRTNIVELFSRKQLYNMGRWLTFKDDTNPSLRRMAMDAKHEAARIKF